jgi:thioredoxin reductase (NADPH)
MIKLYTKENCSFCTKIKKLLQHEQIPYVEMMLSLSDQMLEDFKSTYPGVKTVPFGTIDDKPIGTGDFRSICDYIAKVKGEKDGKEI